MPRWPEKEKTGEQIAEIKDVLALSDDTEGPHHIQRRRTQDEMLRALRLLRSGERLPQDDESAQILEDALGEVITLRQIVADLMQASTTMYQNGLAAIRRMTEK